MTEKNLTAEEFKDKFTLSSEDFAEVGAFSNAIGIYAKKVYPNGYASSYGVEIARHKPQPVSRKSLFAHVTYGKNASDGVYLFDNKLSDPINNHHNIW